ncbi:Xaa-Pro aminopeptidase, partial [Pancytospora epiphaga]
PMPPMTNYKKHIDDLIKEHNLDAYISFTADCHMNEYQCDIDKRVEMLTGFKGSNGTAVTCLNNVLITDSRYYVQAATESSYALYKGKLSEYIISQGFHRVGLDPRLISAKAFESLKKKLEEIGTSIIEIPGKNIERPGGPLTNLEDIELVDFLEYAPTIESHNGGRIRKYLEKIGFKDIKGNVTGSNYKDKIANIRNKIKDKTLIITELDTIAWILNHRGSDIEYNPLFFSYLVITKNTVKLFTNHSISLDSVEVTKYCEFESHIMRISPENILISGDCNRFIYSCFKSVEFTDEIRGMQARKNDNELAGMALAYFYDGVALTNLFAFMSANEGYTENDIADKLDEYKRVFPGYIGPSFQTIAATGTNSVIVHHSSTDRVVDKTEPFLLDCGSHYFFGTTDTSRTLLLEERNEHVENCRVDKKHNYATGDFIHDYSLVFKGHVMAMLTEYESTDTYSTIDKIARKYLQAENKDFGHATGHGVGHVLCVHEHPPTISLGVSSPISSSHVFSVEPGYYRDGFYGIRLENLVISENKGNFHVLRNITMVPYQLSILDHRILTVKEIEYLNAFNSECKWLLEIYLNESGRKYLQENCIIIE